MDPFCSNRRFPRLRPGKSKRKNAHSTLISLLYLAQNEKPDPDHIGRAIGFWSSFDQDKANCILEAAIAAKLIRSLQDFDPVVVHAYMAAVTAFSSG